MNKKKFDQICRLYPESLSAEHILLAILQTVANSHKCEVTLQREQAKWVKLFIHKNYTKNIRCGIQKRGVGIG
jgi:hypothetical protein